MSTVAEVRRAKKAAERAAERHKDAEAALREAIRAAILATKDPDAVAEAAGISKARVYQIRAGVRSQRKES